MTRESVAQNSSAAREIAVGLHRIRVCYRNTVILTGMATAGTVIFAWLCLSCTLDYFLMLQRSLRALLLSLTVAGLAGLGWSLVYRRLGGAALKDDAVALMIERALPAFRSRYIAAVQLARGELASKSLVRALVSETAVLARTQSFHTVVDKRGLRTAWRLLALLLAIAGSLAWAARDKLPPLVRRALLSTEPVPRRTKIELLFPWRILAVRRRPTGQDKGWRNDPARRSSPTRLSRWSQAGHFPRSRPGGPHAILAADPECPGTV
jgi:hypothetical protein